MIKLDVRTNDRILTVNDVLRIKSSALATANPDVKYNCYVLYRADQSLSSEFKQCLISPNFNTGVDLVPKDEIIPFGGSWTIVFEVINLPTATPTGTISVEIYRKQGTATQITSTTVAFGSL